MTLFFVGCWNGEEIANSSVDLKESPNSQSSSAALPDNNLTPLPQRPEFELIAENLTNSENEYLGTRELADIQNRLSSPGLTAAEQINLRGALGWYYLRMGDVDAAVAEIDTAFELRKSTPTGYSIRSLQKTRALIYLRLAEVRNCIQRHNCDCCIFPLTGGGLHVEAEPATEARNVLLDLLRTEPNDLALRWLLNLVCMALGEYPDRLTERYLIPPDAFESDYDIGRFVDIASELGVDTLNLCGGVIAEDFDGDGLIDIVTSTYDPRGPLTYYRNRGDGGFEDLSSVSRLDDQLGGLNCLGADYDNDGDTDILVLRGAWLFDLGKIRNSLIRNNGDGTFTDVTRQAGLAVPAYPTQAAVWGDFDSDGDLDLFVGNECRLELFNDGPFPSQLFQNNGDGTFTDIANAAGVTNNRYAKGVTAGDFDNDGDLDL